MKIFPWHLLIQQQWGVALGWYETGRWPERKSLDISGSPERKTLHISN
jgi:hypothetical protein